MNPLIVALDTPELARIEELAAALGPVAGCLKVGLEAFAAQGPAAVRAATRHGEVFCDLKLHDIPSTVAGAAAAAGAIDGVRFLTVHASGGPVMIEAAAKAAPHVGILAVTVLTSLDDEVLGLVGQAGAAEQVLRLAHLAVEAGAEGIVCAPTDVAAVRAAVGPGPVLVTPGVRPEGAAVHDQARVATPATAIAAGADRIVVGRPITGAADPAAAARAILEELG
ncbi:MAG: orotidine-5'-phosphate decarboxylase [Acidimicrobiia bacterium]